MQVSLNRLVHQNLHSVANIYEDKHQLCGFGAQAQLLQRSVNARRVKVGLGQELVMKMLMQLIGDCQQGSVVEALSLGLSSAVGLGQD